MVAEIDLSSFVAAHADGALVVDVREPVEYVEGHVPGAVLLPLAQVLARAAELPRGEKVYVICATGNRSKSAADWLRSVGVDAVSVAGGTGGWRSEGRPIVLGPHADESAASPPIFEAHPGTPPLEPDMLGIIPIDTPTLGDRSYLVHDGRVAFVIDPQLDIDRVLALAAERGVRVRHVFETHIHNDYVTGGRALADVTGAGYHVNAADPVSFERAAISDGDVVEVSPVLSVRALATPGHTFTHLSFVLLVDGREVAVFTGGSLLFGSTGRPDLLGPDATDALVRAQYRSAHRLAAELPEETDVFPTHGFGSFCSATQTDGTSSTIGQEKRSNPALTESEHDYVEQLLGGLDAFPAYYAHMGPANLAAPALAPDLSLPRIADAGELRERIEAREWVVDLRSRTAFAAGHAPGTLNFGLDGSFATYLGWMVPWGRPITLLGESAEQVAEAQRELVRIGIERPAAAATGSPEQWSDVPLGTMTRATFADLGPARAERDVTVLDVRRDLEWVEGHLVGAVHVPLHELVDRLDEVPAGEVWVHCQGGYRASLAASFLLANGHHVVAVDDEFGNAEKSGLPLEVPSEVAA